LAFRAAFSVEDGVAQLARGIREGVFADVDERRAFYGNYEISADTSSERVAIAPN
jgi:hypothetical protein